MKVGRIMLFPIWILLIYVFLCKGEKIKKNKKLGSLMKSLTERVESNEGENEYARLTQAPTINMKLSKVNFKTSLQNILVESYSEKIKEAISKLNYEISKEKSILDDIKSSNYNLNRLNNLISVKAKKNNKFNDEKIKNIYHNYLNDNNESFGLSLFPVYKTFKSNPSHFNNTLRNSLLPDELIKDSFLSNQNFLKNSTKNVLFPERGDYELKV
ncbi:conserved Plasmodium protein, unknown function [Plasmodium chabaudi adami]|uniref:Fam-b protein n=1 Tax=Plasmodium chabaudi adami TaxID=5826 RepID=A0A1C6YDN6_PLACE|nr:conserved Plasmodium protein, unknown function [Plasmodium chabaudi adami]